MKVAFFDTKEYEKEYFENNLDKEISRVYFQESLNLSFDVDENTKNADIISAFVHSDLSKNVLEKFPNLKAIVLRSVGFSHVDVYYTQEKGIKVLTCPHYGDSSIAEHTFALLLGTIRQICPCAHDVNNGIADDEKYEGIELYGKTIGIIGLGAIGKKVADIALGFNMKPVYFDVQKDENYTFAPLDELFKISDIISLNCPLNEKTLHLLDESRFNQMKDGVIIVNTARGEIIDTKALYCALKEGKVRFLGIDVTECENLLYENLPIKEIDNVRENCLKNYYITRRMLSFKNVLVTSHIAYNTKEAKKRILEMTLENIISSTKFTKEP